MYRASTTKGQPQASENQSCTGIKSTQTASGLCSSPVVCRLTARFIELMRDMSDVQGIYPEPTTPRATSRLKGERLFGTPASRAAVPLFHSARGRGTVPVERDAKHAAHAAHVKRPLRSGCMPVGLAPPTSQRRRAVCQGMRQLMGCRSTAPPQRDPGPGSRTRDSSHSPHARRR